MKLDKPNSHGTMVTMPLPVPYLPDKNVTSLSEKELRELLPKLVQVLQKNVAKRPDWWPHAIGLPWTLKHLLKVIKDANPSSLRTLVQKCLDYLNQGIGLPATPPQPVTTPRVLDWLNSTTTTGTPCTLPKAGLSPEESPVSLAGLTSKKVASMTECEIRELLPKLVEVLQQRYQSKCPEWWPHYYNLPWTVSSLQKSIKDANSSSVRKLALKCFNYLNQTTSEAPLQTKLLMQTQPRVLDWLNSSSSTSCCSPSKSGGFLVSGEKGGMPYLDIYLCYQCNEEFSSKEMLQKHQVQCSGSTMPLAVPSTPPMSEAPSPTPPTVMSDDTSSTSTGIIYPVNRNELMGAIDLLSTRKALRLRCSRRRNTECDAIDLEEPQAPITPNSPRTPKLLISQLSRDASSSGGGGSQLLHSRRRLSYLRQVSEKRPEKEGHMESKVERAESDGSQSSGDDEAEDEPKLHKKSLFMIDVTSALGQRVLKHMTAAAEVKVPVVSDAEYFCHTPIKDKYQDRLRLRQPVYPITWKLTKKRLRQQVFCHTYKFTQSDKEEFMEKMKTGLTWECRQLLKCVRKCSVMLKRLSRKTLYRWKPSLHKITVPLKQLSAQEIRHWTEPKPVTPQPSVFPDGPTFLFTDIDRVLGLKRKDGDPEVSRKLLTSHCVSESANAELQLQKLTVYRSLLTDLSSCSVSDREETNEKEKQYPALFAILSSSNNPASKNVWQHKERRDVNKPLKIEIPGTSSVRPAVLKSKLNSPLDDGFSIVSVSSSDEEFVADACCTLCRKRSACFCSPERVSPSGQCSPSARTNISPKLTPKTLTITNTLYPPALSSPESLSANSSLSPPTLSPMTHRSQSCPTSPSASSIKLLTRSSTVSPNSITKTLSSKVRSSSRLHRSQPPPVSIFVRPAPKRRAGKGVNGEDIKFEGLLQPVSRQQTSSRGSLSSAQSENPLPLASTTTHGKNTKHRQASISPVASSRRENLIRQTRSSTQLVEEHGSRLLRTERHSNSSERDLGKAKEGSAFISNDSFSSLAAVSRTLRSGAQQNSLTAAESVGVGGSLSDKTKNVASTSSAAYSPNTRRSTRVGNPFANVEETKSGEALSFEPRGLKRTAQEAFGEKESVNKSEDKVSADNPFIGSKVQTQLFSTSVLQQARRSWRPACKSPVRDSGAGAPKAVLRSGTTFRVGGVALSTETPPSQNSSLDSDSHFSSPKWKRAKPLSLLSELGNVPEPATALKTPPHTSFSPLSPSAKKRLSPQEMLTVLESTKGRNSTSRVKGLPASIFRTAGVGLKKKQSAGTNVTTVRAGYVTRAKQSDT